MGVRKFRSVEEMERPASYAPDDPRIWEAAVRRWRSIAFSQRDLGRPLGRACSSSARSKRSKLVERGSEAIAQRIARIARTPTSDREFPGHPPQTGGPPYWLPLPTY